MKMLASLIAVSIVTAGVAHAASAGNRPTLAIKLQSIAAKPKVKVKPRCSSCDFHFVHVYDKSTPVLMSDDRVPLPR